MHLGNAGWENKLINSQAVSENKQRPSLWELMQSDQNRTPMCALVFSSGPLPSERQSEYCIRRSVCVESQCVRHTNRHRGIQMNKWSGQTEGRRRQMKDIQRLKEKGRDAWWEAGIDAWQRAGSPANRARTHTRARATYLDGSMSARKTHKYTHRHTHTFLLLRVWIANYFFFFFKLSTQIFCKHINVWWKQSCDIHTD